jgi:hypothetical protein
VKAQHVRLISDHGELVGEGCAGCLELTKELTKYARENTRLKNAEAERLGLAADAPTIRDILQHHKRLFPGTKIITGKAAWKAVRARLADVDENGDRAFTLIALKAAAMGLKLGRTGEFADRPHGAAWLYGDEERVQYWIGRCVMFKREVGVSAMEIVDELGKPGLAKLAARCSHCGRMRFEHEHEPDAVGLFDPLCPGFDDFDWEIDVWKRQRDQLAAERAREDDAA